MVKALSNRENHLLSCGAPICAADQTPDWKKSVIWYPGESVCALKMQQFQKTQRRINKLVGLGGFKNKDTSFTANSLERIGRVTNSTKGKRQESKS